MAIIKCKMCGGDLNIIEGASTAQCEYCGTKQTLPRTGEETIRNLLNRANTLRLQCEFDKAEQLYEKILQEDAGESEAYWGIVLCKYGIEYVEDPKTGKRTPTCHRTSYDAVVTDADYRAAIENADAAQREVYEAEAKWIDRIQKHILNTVKDEPPFDVFICYKETDEQGKRTVDSAIANDIYYQLIQEGYRVFYAPITLEDKLGYEYEPYIFAALNTAKIMLVVGTKPEYFNAVWVKNEWGRFLKLMKADRSKLLVPCYRDMDAYDLPEEFAHLQSQDMSRIGFITDLIRGIKKLIAPVPQKEEAAPPARPAPAAPKRSLWQDPWREKALLVSGIGLLLLVLLVFAINAAMVDRYGFRSALFRNLRPINIVLHLLLWAFAAGMMFVGVGTKRKERFFLLPMAIYTYTMFFPLVSRGLLLYFDVMLLYVPGFLAGCLSIVFILLRRAKNATFTVAALQFLAKACLIMGCGVALLLLVMNTTLPFLYINLTVAIPAAICIAMWDKEKKETV